MKRILILVFFVFSCTLSFAQEKGTLKDGYQVFKYPNGTISSEGLIKNGKPEGFWKSFYVTGVKKSEGRRTNYLLDSIWVFYDQSGDTTEKINYLYGKKMGGIINIKLMPQEEFIFYLKSYILPTKKKELLMYIFRMERSSRHLLITTGKKKAYQKNMTEMEI